MTKKNTIEDFCAHLNDNVEEKTTYLKECDDIRFLPLFYKFGVLNLNKEGSWAASVYLKRMLNNHPDSKEEVVQIINASLGDNDLSSLAYYELIQLLKDLGIAVFANDIKYKVLFNQKFSLSMCKWLLSDAEIINHPKLYQECIKSIIKYSVHENSIWKTKQVVSFYSHGIYQIERFIKETPYLDNLRKILSDDNIYALLIETYKNIVKEASSLSIIDRQYIKNSEEKARNLSQYDMRNIIVDLLAISLEENNSDDKIQKLVDSDEWIFKKLGLYIISLKYDNYKQLFLEFLNQINSQVAIECLYETLTIFEIISSNSKKMNYTAQEVDKQIVSTILDKLDSWSDELKYRWLYYLKEHEVFSDLFIKQQAKFPEADTNSLKFSFYIEPITIDDIQPALPNDLETLRKIMKNLEDSTSYDYKSWNDFLDCLVNSNSEMCQFEAVRFLEKIIDTNKDNQVVDKLFNILETLIIKYKPSFDDKTVYNWQMRFYVAKLPMAQYLKLWFNLLITNQDLYNTKIQFLLKEFKVKTDDAANCVYSYYWGYYYDFLDDKIQASPYQLSGRLKDCFTEGFVNHICTIEAFEKLEPLVFENLEAIISSTITKDNFLYAMVDITFAHNGLHIFNKYRKKFSKELLDDFCFKILYPRRAKYDSNLLLTFWKDMVKAQFVDYEILLQLFNEYSVNEDFEPYIDDLILLLTLMNNQKECLSNNNDLQDLLQKLKGAISFINKVKGYELLNILIEVISRYEYIFNEDAVELKCILAEYSKLEETQANLIVLRQKIVNTKNLIQYSALFAETE